MHTHCDKYVFQREIGEEQGGLHYQMGIKFKVKAQKKIILDMMNSWFPELPRDTFSAQAAGDKINLLAYCSKVDGQLDADGNVVKGGRAPGAALITKGIDPSKLVLNADGDPRKRRNVCDLFDMNRSTFWQDFIIAYIASWQRDPLRTREILYVYDNIGNNGKSVLCKHLILEHDCKLLDNARKNDVYSVVGKQ
ncbi:MAG: hypothetical protein JST16_04820 [Bdellovibrionales bacterium]|nr:hypothetical protein [Bdellovibrionales bacterium]